MKNAVAMDGAELCHPGYVGDSVLGHKAHFGCQALTANLPLLQGGASSGGLSGGPSGASGVSVGLPSLEGRKVDLGRLKLGAIMGDACQLGCNSVTEVIGYFEVVGGCFC